MDPSSVPAFGQFNAQADLGRVINNVAPLATTWHGVAPPPQINYAAPVSHAGQGVLPAFWGKVESVASEAGHMAVGAGSFLAHAGVDAIEAPYKFGEGIARAGLNYATGQSLAAESKQNEQRLNNLMASYKSGQITGKQYTQSLKDLSQESTNLQKDLANFQSSTSIDEKNFSKAAVNTAADFLAIYTLGGSAATLDITQQAATQAVARSNELTAGAAAISKLATSFEDWKAVSPLAQQAIKMATNEVLSAAGQSATAQQIARAVAANLLIKYPFTYNFISGAGQQVYTELDNNKYGDAVKTAAFNAALLFSGGPIGWGLKQAGGLLKDTSVAAGLRPGSVLDELSSRIGNGDRRALAQIAQGLVDNGNAKDVKSMIVGLESNLARAGGNSSKAVNFITDHLENYIGWGSMKNLTHQEAWDNIVNYWKHAEGLQKLKEAGKIEGVASSDGRAIVPGRFTIQDKNAIAAAVGTDGEKGWAAFKEANPNSAAANNPNLDRQITRIINTTTEGKERSNAIRNIPAQFGLEGIPKEYADQMAKDGYVAIIPKNHNLPVTPFEQTSGVLATNSAEGSYFVKAAKPVPVLRSIGNALVYAGLSPEVATQRVGEVFNANLTSQLERVGYRGLQGDTVEQTGQDVVQKLSNYMKKPTVGKMMVNGAPLRTPLTDMRQLTTKDVMAALGVTRSVARDVQDAILQAHLEVPRQITGIGPKILDYNFKYNPVAGWYSRTQGALRFAWNPIFTQGRLPIKAEILSQLETGGKFPTVAGTNTFMKLFFPGQYKEIDAIAKDGAFKALMPGGLGAEAADITGFTDSGKGFNINTLRPVAGVVRSMADKMGMDTKDFIAQYPEKVQDAAQAILHYDHNASFLNSPMARTLNIAFFPFRFNTKVATFMAKALVQQSPGVQYAVIKGTMDAHKFLTSPQGQAWYSQNADAIGLFKYFSPLETLSVISNALQLKHDSVAQYGELGGLPFGMIPLMLDSAGLTHFGQAYVDPKTGAIAKDYVPTSMYGVANAAIQDLLGSLYTYPGAEVGLPSKGKINRTIVGGILPGSSKDFKAQQPTNVTPEDQQFSNNVQQSSGNTPQQIPSPSILPGTSVPAQGSSLETRNPNKKISAGGSNSGPKKKKGDYTPALLPGQSQLGQL